MVRNITRTRRHSVDAADMEPNVVASNADDDWLEHARDIVQGEESAGDEAGVIQKLAALFQAHPERDSFELLSHSNDDDLLKIGTWVVGTTAFQTASQDFKNQLRGKTIRLVGCNTAESDEANDVLLALESNFGLQAYGATGIIGLADLDAGGSKSNERADRFTRPTPGASGTHAKAVGAGRGDHRLAPVHAVTESELLRAGPWKPFTTTDRQTLRVGLVAESGQKLDAMFGNLPDRYYQFRGLLRIPSSTTYLKTMTPDNNPRAGRVDTYFSGQLVRITRAPYQGAPFLEYLFWHPDALRAGPSRIR